MSYYLESKNWNLLGDVLWECLSENEQGDRAFKQDFQRAWTALAFKTPREALQAARQYLGHDNVYLNEAGDRIMVVYEDEVLESFRITTDA